ncbi:integrase core domain-containing protein [Streptomyces sp. IBSBF 2435]|uniref:integrase core domain-containing protein n=1 Tax=Streptomyces sp. IBSBF 2435 TaxID=2903531 RepID=UPI003FA6CB08
MTNGRNRINHGGHRQLNAAIYRTVIVRMRFLQPTTTTSRAAQPKARRSARSSDASGATSYARSTTRSDPPHGRPPQPVDNYRSVNALAEAFNSLFKAELIGMQGPWKDVEQAERAIFQWITWYNEERLHSALGYVPPAEYEQDYRRSQEPAPQSA